MNKTEAVKRKVNKSKSYIAWTWPVIIGFFALSVIDIRFALLGFACMLMPVSFALAGKGKKHCSHYCPRGSFFGKFLPRLSLNGTLPAFMDNKIFKHALLVFMFTMFGNCLLRTGGDYSAIAFVMFRMMLASTIVGLLIGVIFKPRSWCKICPMGHMAGLIKEGLDK